MFDHISGNREGLAMCTKPFEVSEISELQDSPIIAGAVDAFRTRQSNDSEEVKSFMWWTDSPYHPLLGGLTLAVFSGFSALIDVPYLYPQCPECSVFMLVALGQEREQGCEKVYDVTVKALPGNQSDCIRLQRDNTNSVLPSRLGVQFKAFEVHVPPECNKLEITIRSPDSANGEVILHWNRPSKYSTLQPSDLNIIRQLKYLGRNWSSRQPRYTYPPSKDFICDIRLPVVGEEKWCNRVGVELLCPTIMDCRYPTIVEAVRRVSGDSQVMNLDMALFHSQIDEVDFIVGSSPSRNRPVWSIAGVNVNTNVLNSLSSVYSYAYARIPSSNALLDFTVFELHEVLSNPEDVQVVYDLSQQLPRLTWAQDDTAAGIRPAGVMEWARSIISNLHYVKLDHQLVGDSTNRARHGAALVAAVCSAERRCLIVEGCDTPDRVQKMIQLARKVFSQLPPLPGTILFQFWPAAKYDLSRQPECPHRHIRCGLDYQAVTVP